MAEFTAEVFQNEFLPDGGTDVNAIVTLICSGAGSAGQTGSGDAGEIIIVDTSGSMGRVKLDAAKVAAAAAVDQILDGTWFAVVAGTHQAYLAFPAGTYRERAWSAWTATRGTGCASGHQPIPFRRGHGDGNLAHARWSAVRLGAGARTAARDLAHRR